ncbi:MAG: L,D-transpeptidase family protein [Ktedonobacteraceae bacterium]|nr:L,D-transpeptidase family protein [Ktedonobacteraceae bacterium]
MKYPTLPRQRSRKLLAFVSVAFVLALLLSACGDPQQQQQANKNKADLDALVTHAQSIGVPAPQLNTIIQQEKKLSQTSAPLTLFSNQPSADYYSNLAQNYSILTVQVRGLEIQTTQQSGYQASKDLKQFANLLSQRQSQGFVEAKNFNDQLTQSQKQMTQAQYPKQYLQISSDAEQATQSLQMLGTASDKLTSLQNQVKQLKDSKLDTTALDQQVQGDAPLLRKAMKPTDFSNVISMIDAQTQQVSTLSLQAIPYVGADKLHQFNGFIGDMKKYGGDTTKYQSQYNTDKAALDSAKTVNDFLKFSTQMDKDLNNIHLPLMQSQAQFELGQFSQAVTAFNNSHPYHDAFDGKSYTLGYEYLQRTVPDIQDDLSAAQSSDDYQAVIDETKELQTHFNAMEVDYADQTPYTSAHAADMTLMKYHGVTSGMVIVASLVNETMHVYQNGQLIKSFLITSGQFTRPSAPGFTHIFKRESPATFHAFDQDKSSPFYFPDTKINYAMEYHAGEYYFHDSWWRSQYGPHTEFPHSDPGAENTGSHGCINLAENDAAWLYANTDYNTAAIVY